MGRVDLAGRLSDARDRVDAEAAPEDRGLAMYARLIRKDARIRPDQDAALTALAKTLMRRRRAKSERITENTLIRVAIDLLLARADELRGSTEAELRQAATSIGPHPRSSVLPQSGSPAPPHSQGPEVPSLRTAGDPSSRSPVGGDSGISGGASDDSLARGSRDSERRGWGAGSEVER